MGLLLFGAPQHSHGRWCCAGSCCQSVPQALLITSCGSALSLRSSGASRLEIYFYLASLGTAVKASQQDLRLFSKPCQQVPACGQGPPTRQGLRFYFNIRNAQDCCTGITCRIQLMAAVRADGTLTS